MERLQRLFDKYIEKTTSFKRIHCKELVPITELNGVISLCRLYDSLANLENGVRTFNLHHFYAFISHQTENTTKCSSNVQISIT